MIADDDYISVRDWRRKPPLHLRVAQDEEPGEPAAVIEGRLLTRGYTPSVPDLSATHFDSIVNFGASRISKNLLKPLSAPSRAASHVSYDGYFGLTLIVSIEPVLIVWTKIITVNICGPPLAANYVNCSAAVVLSMVGGQRGKAPAGEAGRGQS